MLAASVPTLPAGPRGVLAGTWLPGRLMSLESMSALCPGFEETFRSGWLARLPRRGEGEHLLDWASPGSSWLGCSRETAVGGEGPAEAGEEPADTGAPSAVATPPTAPASPKAVARANARAPRSAEEGGRLLWMLSGKGGVWFLEALSSGDRATYCFAGGEEMPALVSRLLCAPQFSREALYGPLDTLTGERAELAIAAQFLGFLVRLRGCFRGRVIHRSIEGWQAEMDALGGTSPSREGFHTGRALASWAPTRRCTPEFQLAQSSRGYTWRSTVRTRGQRCFGGLLCFWLSPSWLRYSALGIS